MKLIFVYNANSGWIDKLIDSGHKIVSPATYDCNLCAITYGNFKEDSLWKSFRKQSKLDLQFFYKDEFNRQYKSKWLPKFEFPIILTEQDDTLEVFISTEILNTLKTSEALIEEIKKHLIHY